MSFSFLLSESLTLFYVCEKCVKCMRLLMLSSCVEGIVGGWGCSINHMWLWPAKPAPWYGAGGSRRICFPPWWMGDSLIHKDTHTHADTQTLDCSWLCVFTSKGSATSIWSDRSPRQRLHCLFVSYRKFKSFPVPNIKSCSWVLSLNTHCSSFIGCWSSLGC